MNTPYRDENGNLLTEEQLRKILRKNMSSQYNWWHAKAQHRFGADRPPPGVRQGTDIRRL